MKPDVTTDNSIFIYTMAGVLLFIAAFGFTLANFSSIAMLRLSYTFIAFILGGSSVALLYKAIKQDKDRLRQA